MEKRTPWKPSRRNRVQHFGRTDRFDGGSHLDIVMHHPKPAAVSQRSQSISLGVGGANHASPSYPSRALSAKSETLGPLRDCSGLWMVHDERDPAVESFGLTEMLEPIPGTLIPRGCAW